MERLLRDESLRYVYGVDVVQYKDGVRVNYNCNGDEAPPEEEGKGEEEEEDEEERGERVGGRCPVRRLGAGPPASRLPPC